jgi:retinol dehydrogenase-12
MAGAGAMNAKTCLVTGATSGIGFATARALASQGATTVLVARSAERGAGCLERIRTCTGNDRVELLIGDLSLMADVRRITAELTRSHDRLDVLVNNAGAYFSHRQETAEGLEMTFALDLLSPFLLTTLLLSPLEAGAPSRVINVCSRAHRWGRIDLMDVEGKRRYRGFAAYCAAKLGLVMLTYDLAERLRHTGVCVNAVNPGFVATGWGQNNSGLAGATIAFGGKLFGRTVEEGADPLVYLATSADVEGLTGRYFFDHKTVPSSRSSHDARTSAALRRICERMAGLAE